LHSEVKWKSEQAQKLQNECFTKDAELNKLKKELEEIRGLNFALKKQLEDEKLLRQIPQP